MSELNGKSSDDYIPLNGVGHTSSTEHIEYKELNAQRQKDLFTIVNAALIYGLHPK